MSVPWHLIMRLGEPVQNFGPRWPDSLSASGFLLGATSRLKVMSLLVVPCEQPVSMAKALATLDWISGGRAIPMLMTGYLDWEFEFLGVPFAERGAIMDEYVDAMIELWEADEPRFHGKYVQFDDIAFEPKPAQKPLPLWFGGRTKAALRRIARHGSGWLSYATPHREMLATVEYIRSQPAFESNPRPLEVSAYFVESTHDPVSHEEKGGRRIVVGNDQVLEQLEYLASIGVSLTGAPLDSMAGPSGGQEPIAGVEEYIERLEWFAEELMPAGRELKTPFEEAGQPAGVVPLS
jgi:alkanesulfonate monooxygenase SsuD/methylene tetrahydromethanopterin reductase-like flavin-dependent oxidoreductase (luciferase family)